MKCLRQVILACVSIHVVMSQQPPGVPPHHQPGVVPPQQQGGQQNYQAGQQQQQVNQGYQQQGQVNNMQQPPPVGQGYQQQQQPVGQGYQQQPVGQGYQQQQQPVGQGYQQQQPAGQGYQQQQPAGHTNPHEHVTEGTGHDTLKFKSDVHNKEHIMEHLQEVIETKPKEQMTEEELEFHYFKMHDYNGDNKLDGVEIGKALTHYHGEGDSEEQKPMSDQDIESVVDLVLKDDDADGDGYVTYSEFVASQRNIRNKENENNGATEETHNEP